MCQCALCFVVGNVITCIIGVILFSKAMFELSTNAKFFSGSFVFR